MEHEYNFYVKVIKPLEKKYNRLCFLHSIFKFKFLKDKMKTYNNYLIIYYIMINKDDNYLKKLEKQLKK